MVCTLRLKLSSEHTSYKDLKPLYDCRSVIKSHTLCMRSNIVTWLVDLVREK